MPPRKRAPAKKATTTSRKPRPRKLTDRDRRVLELRRAGIAFDKIATQLKYRDRDEVYAAYERALAETLPEPAEAVRRLELDRLERLMTPLWAKAMRGDVAAISELARLSAQRTRVIGEGSPLQPEVETKREAGPAERATVAEVQRLQQAAHPLAESAVVMARCIDENDSNALAASAASRELRQILNALHAHAGEGGPKSRTGKGEGDGVVTPPSRLAEMRAKAQARGASQ